MPLSSSALCVLALFALLTPSVRAQPDVSAYDPILTNAAESEAGCMIVGNGEVGVNVWVERDGDLVMYISRNDAHSETQRLMKLGRVRFSLLPNPFQSDPVTGQVPAFRMRLNLNEGRVEIAAGEQDKAVELTVLVDAESPVVYVTGTASAPHDVRILLETWRDQPRVLRGGALASSWVLRDAPADVNARESADQFPDWGDNLVWFHRNEWSCVPLHIEKQGLGEVKDLVPDPILNTTFGGWLTCAHTHKIDTWAISGDGQIRDFDMRIVAHADQVATLGGWTDKAKALSAAAVPPAEAKQRTAAWWKAYWERSWIRASGPDAEKVTGAYVASKYLFACQARSAFPIRFQGGMFTVSPKLASYGPKVPTEDMTPDYRFYGVSYWFQNARLLYHPMLAQGSIDFMKPFFDFYTDFTALYEARSNLLYKAKGVFIPETSSIFGLPGMGDWGWHQVPPGKYSEPYTKDVWQQSLELAALMLDAYDHSRDEKFLREQVIPWANKSLEFFDTRFPKDAEGRIRIEPSHAVETYWTGVVNDLPCVAGLHAVTQRLLALPESLTTGEDRAFWTRLAGQLPAIPIRTVDGVKVFSPAEAFDPKRTNYETPELYGVFPFRLAGIGLPNRDIAVETWRRRTDPTKSCWHQDGLNAALLGLTEEARADVVARAGLTMPGFAFPGFFSSPHDWCPDHDGAGNLMSELQFMLMQTRGDEILLFPAWPAAWDATFKLHAPKNTVLEGEFKGGKLARLVVTPESRRADVKILEPAAP